MERENHHNAKRSDGD